MIRFLDFFFFVANNFYYVLLCLSDKTYVYVWIDYYNGQYCTTIQLIQTDRSLFDMLYYYMNQFFIEKYFSIWNKLTIL